MARDTDHLAGGLDTENTGGLLTGFLAEEEEFDPRSLWRLGSWGAASLGAVIVALYASQSSIGLRREQLAAADLLRQSQQIQTASKESQNETRRLASAVETLNSDRDRLYSRVTFLEQGLGSVTGAIARQNSAMAPAQAAAVSSTTVEPQPAAQNAGSVPVVSPMATRSAAAAAAIEKPRADAPAPAPAPEQAQPTLSPVGQGTPAAPATPLVASKSMMAPPDAGATKLIEPEKSANAVTAAPMPKVVASVTPDEEAQADAAEASVPKLAVQRTEFGVDVGGANSLNGLRALWRGLLKSRSNAPLTGLRPIIVVKETSTGLGMQLRLVAGPLHDAAAAATICAVMIENNRTCETTVFDGQRLAIKADDPTAVALPSAAKPVARGRNAAKRVTTTEDPVRKPDPSTIPSSTPSTPSSLFGRR